MEELRKQILLYLEKHSRVDLGELAVLLGTDEVTVANEISAMERAKIICGYHTLIDWDKTGTEYVNALIEVKVTDGVFRRSATEIREIIRICQENGIEITGSIFSKNSKQLKENIEYIKQNYGEEYLTTLIVSKNLKHLQRTLPYLQSIGALETTKTSASILLLTLEEIKERQAFIKNIGETIVIDGKFNRIFGMPKKRYQKKVKEYEEKKKIIGDIKGAIQEGQELDEQINSKEQSQK